MILDKQNTVNRMIGVGQNPTPALFQQVMQIGFTQVPVIEYVTWTFELPLLDTEIQSTFGDEIDILQNPKSVTGITSVDSSFVINGILQVDMLVVGFGIHMFGEPLAFTQIGNAMIGPPSAGTPPIVSSDVWTLLDASSGALGAFAKASAGNVVPAEMEWGVADWEALWHMANAYQFQWIMQQRYLLINELAADVSYFGPYADAVAAGTSEVPIAPYVKQMNARYRFKNGGGIFVPINARRVGSVNGIAGATGLSGLTGPNTGVFHPTRDFDLAPVTWGGIRNQGSAGCCNPFRRLIQPVLLEKGLPIGMLLRVQDQYHQTQMQKFLSISESTNTNQAIIQFDAAVNGTSVANAMPELTLDQPPNLFSFQQVNTDRDLFKGGVAKAAILIKGFEVWGPWQQYLQNAVGTGQIGRIGSGPIGFSPSTRIP